MKSKALFLFKNNQLNDAKIVFTGICESDPDDAESWFHLAIINSRLELLEEAVECFRRAGLIQPKRAIIHYNLGNVLNQMGNYAAAEKSYREAIRLNPQLAGAHTNLGNLLHKQRRLEEALSAHSAAVSLSPTSHEAFFNLGNVQCDLYKFDEALENYHRAVHLKPDFALCYNHMGLVFHHMGRIEYAKAAYAKALSINPDYLTAWNNLGNLLTAIGPWDQALASFQRANAIDPTSIVAKIGEAKVLERQGEYEASYERLRPFIEMDELNYDAVITYAALCRPLNLRDESISLLEKLLRQKQTSLDNEKLAHLHSELGRLYDSKQDYSRAFSHYERGNDILRQSRPFDIEEIAQYIESHINTYDLDFLSRAPRSQSGSTRPIFIIGMPRSGTTLVEQILASHPEIYGGGELEKLGQLVSEFSNMNGSTAGYPACITTANPNDIEHLAKGYLDYLGNLSAHDRRITDKMPSNYIHLGLINLLFPEARVIHCTRDPMDTCLSCYFQSFGWRIPYTLDLKTLGRYYRLYQRLMNHWKSVIDIAFMEVRYEDLVKDLAGTSKTIINFCGLEWNDRCLEFHNTKRVVATASHDQVRQPIYKKSIGRWRNYDAHLEPLRRALMPL